MENWFLLFTAGLIDPILIIGGLVAGVLWRSVAWWAALAVILITPAVEFYEMISRQFRYIPDYGFIVALYTSGVAAIAAWSVIGRWVAYMAAPRERPQEGKGPFGSI